MNTGFRICQGKDPKMAHNKEISKMCQLQSDLFSVRVHEEKNRQNNIYPLNPV